MLHFKNRVILICVFLSLSLTSPAFSFFDSIRLAKESIARQSFDLAIHYLTNEIRENPNNTEAYALRAKTYQLMGDLLNAAADKKRLYEIDPEYFISVSGLNRGDTSQIRTSQKDVQH